MKTFSGNKMIFKRWGPARFLFEWNKYTNTHLSQWVYMYANHCSPSDKCGKSDKSSSLSLWMLGEPLKSEWSLPWTLVCKASNFRFTLFALFNLLFQWLVYFGTSYSSCRWSCLLINAFFLFTSMNHSCMSRSSSTLSLPAEKITMTSVTRLRWRLQTKTRKNFSWSQMYAAGRS